MSKFCEIYTNEQNYIRFLFHTDRLQEPEIESLIDLIKGYKNNLYGVLHSPIYDFVMWCRYKCYITKTESDIIPNDLLQATNYEFVDEIYPKDNVISITFAHIETKKGVTIMHDDLEKWAKRNELNYWYGVPGRWNGVSGLQYVNVKDSTDYSANYEAKKPEPTPAEKQKEHIRNAKSRLQHLNIKKVIFNDLATIVFFRDGTKTIVKCSEHDYYSKESAIALALMKHNIGDDCFKYAMNALIGAKKCDFIEVHDTEDDKKN